MDEEDCSAGVDDASACSVDVDVAVAAVALSSLDHASPSLPTPDWEGP